MAESEPGYVFRGRGNYGTKPISTEEFRVAYESAPACHHPRGIDKVAIESLDLEMQGAVLADIVAEDLDVEMDLFRLLADPEALTEQDIEGPSF